MNWLDDALLDLWIFTLHRVGHEHMTYEELWRDWIDHG